MVILHQKDNQINDAQPLWRYISFSKFISLLITRKLHFTRTDLFFDTFESSIPVKDLEQARNYFADKIKTGIVDIGGEEKLKVEGLREHIKYFLNLSTEDANAISDDEFPSYLLKIANRFQFVNCWHMNENESAGMWQLYMNANEGVAIQTTIGDLKNCLSTGQYPIYLGPITYLDYQKGSSGKYEPLNPIFHKRNSFAHEQEVRAVIVSPSDIDARTCEGIMVEINLDELIKKIIISPKAEPWFKETVDLVCKDYGLQIQSVPSELYSEPAY